MFAHKYDEKNRIITTDLDKTVYSERGYVININKYFDQLREKFASKYSDSHSVTLADCEYLYYAGGSEFECSKNTDFLISVDPNNLIWTAGKWLFLNERHDSVTEYCTRLNKILKAMDDQIECYLTNISRPLYNSKGGLNAKDFRAWLGSTKASRERFLDLERPTWSYNVEFDWIDYLPI